MEKNKRSGKLNKLGKTLKEHILNNKKEYIIVILMFAIGIFFGVLFVNNAKEAQLIQIKEYLTSFIENLKKTEQLNNVDLIKTSLIQNILLAIIIWFFGTTVIGIPVVFGMIIYRGFCLGYTISSCITALGLSKGLLFALISMLLQNLILVPAILAIAVSGIKLYKSIMKDKRKENIKLEIVRHILFSLLMLILVIISSIIEILGSTGILKLVIKYF